MGLLDSDMTQLDPNAVASAAPNPTITVPPSLLQRIASGLNTFNQGVGAGMNSPLFTLGMGMLQGAQPFQNIGSGIMAARSNQLQQQLGQQQYGLNQLQVAPLLARLQALNIDPSALGINLNALGIKPQQGLLPQPTQQPPSGPGLMPQPQGGPFGGLSQQSPNAAGAQPSRGAAAPSWLTPLTSQDIDSTAVSGMDPQYLKTNAVFSQDPTAQLAALRAQQIAVRKQQEAPILSRLDTLAKSDNPVQYMQADQNLAAAWPVLAQQLGLDPVKDLNAQNVRTAFTFERNALGAPLGEAAVAPTVQKRTVPTGVGGSYQVDPVTGAISAGVPQQETANFVTPSGIRMLPKAQGMRLGYAPYTPQTYINTGTTDPMAQMIANYKSPPLSGYALRSPQGQAIMAEVNQLNPNYDATQYGAKVKARDAFATGKQGDTVRSLSVATNHLNQLSDMVDALGNNNIRVFNRLGNAWNQETGSSAPTNFDTVKNVVADEVTKAILGYGGSQSDRDKAAAVISRSNSPTQLKSAISQYERLMGGQLDGLRRQYEHSTGLKDFDTMLSPQAQAQVEATAPNTGGGAASPQAPGRVLVYDPKTGTIK